MFGRLRGKVILVVASIAHSIVYIKIAFVLVGLSFINSESIRYFQSQTISLEPHSTEAYDVPLNDSISENNALFKVLSEDKVPIRYYRKIFTSVCFDNKCRSLSINLYWNITGRYLGFELLDGEFLSKTDHEPFSLEEYEKLNQILATESTPLANLDYSQLAVEPNSHGFGDVDAISSETPQNLAPYVIKGAAYTTFKLWHLIHGATKKEVQDFTIREISPELLLKILQSSVQADQLWASEHIDGYVDLTPKLRKKVFELINGDDYLIIEKALNTLNKDELDSSSVQRSLLNALLGGDYNVQALVIDKIEQCSFLEDAIKTEMVENLGHFNGQVFKKTLGVLENQKLTLKMYRTMAELLQSENGFISNNIASFLKNKDIRDSKIRSLLRKHEK